jgi:flavin reductase (DIM6/NTAB) family NADH-FMN oxidoreductase RutF
VTTRTPDGRPCGLTATAVSSLSLDPALVLACVERTSDTHDCILSRRAFAVSVLAHDAERIARHFAVTELDAKFEGIAYREELTGSPVLDAAMAWVDCELHAHYDGGDHSIFVGRVMRGDASDEVPLVYFRGGYGKYTP